MLTSIDVCLSFPLSKSYISLSITEPVMCALLLAASARCPSCILLQEQEVPEEDLWYAALLQGNPKPLLNLLPPLVSKRTPQSERPW